jgi:hypothetical protein
MRPLAVLNAIIFGSAAAITFGLSGVVIIYLILQQRHPQLAAEFGVLLRSDGIFASLAAMSGLSLVAMLKGLRWRWIAQMAMWLSLAATCVWFWPG